MLFCGKCDKNVDFNSVAISKPIAAYTVDIKGPIDPTLIHSETGVINVCKNCGSQNLHVNKSCFIRHEEALVKKQNDEEQGCLALGIGGLFAILPAVWCGQAVKNGFGPVLVSWVLFTFVFGAIVAAIRSSKNPSGED